MPSVTLKAHYDGERIQLDEPFDLPPNATRLVTVPPLSDGDGDRVAWLAASRAALLKAASLIRLDFLAVPPASSLLGAIGSIEPVRHVRLLERLRSHLRPAVTAVTGATPEGS